MGPRLELLVLSQFDFLILNPFCSLSLPYPFSAVIVTRNSTSEGNLWEGAKVRVPFLNLGLRFARPGSLVPSQQQCSLV